MNKKVIIISLISLSIFIVGCGNKQIVKPTSNTIDTQTNTKPQTLKPNINNTVATPNSNSITKSSIVNSTTTKKSTPVITIQKSSQVSTKEYDNIAEKTKNYIFNGQGNIPEYQKIHWSKTFLNRVDIISLYKKYIANGGNKNNLSNFAKYMTINAPIQSDWKVLFEKDLYDSYKVKVVRLVHVKDDIYQAYIISNGSEIPYVGVYSRTGYFHG